MNNNKNDIMQYTGIVTLSQYIGNKKVKLASIHNNGGEGLFNFIVDCLMGEFVTAEFNRPAKIKLLQESGSLSGASPYIYLLTNPARVYPNEENLGCAVRYSFVIPRELLETEFNAIGLYADAATEQDLAYYVAKCYIDAASIMADTSSALVVDWDLTFTNAPNINLSA